MLVFPHQPIKWPGVERGGVGKVVIPVTVRIAGGYQVLGIWSLHNREEVGRYPVCETW